MKPINNYANIQASTGEFSRPTAGGYIIRILDVTDVPLDATTGKGDYLKIDYDICEGEFANYYKEANKRFGGEWFANFIRSYKEKALGMFKHFTNCIEESNKGYEWDWNEKELIGKKIGVTMQEEEYKKSDGSIGVRLRVKDIKTVKQIATGDFKVPERKCLEIVPATSNNGFVEVDLEDDLPFA
jgi:hypothetical protein